MTYPWKAMQQRVYSVPLYRMYVYFGICVTVLTRGTMYKGSEKEDMKIRT